MERTKEWQALIFQSAIAHLRSKIVRRVSEPFAALANALARLVRPAGGRAVAHDESFAITTPVVETAGAVVAEIPLAKVDAAAFSALLPSAEHELSVIVVAHELPLVAEVLVPTASAHLISPVSPPDALAPRSLSPELAIDPELESMRTKVVTLETRLVDLEAQKAEMEQLLEAYAFSQFRVLGELLDEHLRLRHETLVLRAQRSSNPEDIQAADAAAREYADYRQARDTASAPRDELPDDERDELKALYRSAAMRCHPDRVDETAKAGAHEMFLRVQDAYRQRDLEAMRLIDRQLAAAVLPSAARDQSTTRERLEAFQESLLDKGVELLLAIQAIKISTEYRQARCRDEWEDHFAALRDKLENECVALRRELSRG